MYKYILNAFYMVSDLEKHREIKNKLLPLIDTAECGELKQKDDFYGDDIGRVDWENCKDFSREWVEYFKPYLQVELDKMAGFNGFSNATINELWFQQYKVGGAHGWHTHSSNWTGVYYLDMSDEAPVTDLVNPWTLNDVFTPEVSEGSIILFPSFTIHRAPVIKSDITKTIISFNVDFGQLTKDCVTHCNNLVNDK